MSEKKMIQELNTSQQQLKDSLLEVMELADCLEMQPTDIAVATGSALKDHLKHYEDTGMLLMSHHPDPENENHFITVLAGEINAHQLAALFASKELQSYLMQLYPHIDIKNEEGDDE